MDCFECGPLVNESNRKHRNTRSETYHIAIISTKNPTSNDRGSIPGIHVEKLATNPLWNIGAMFRIGLMWDKNYNQLEYGAL